MKNLLNKIFKKIKHIYNYLRIDLNIVFNIPYDFIVKKTKCKQRKVYRNLQ